MIHKLAQTYACLPGSIALLALTACVASGCASRTASWDRNTRDAQAQMQTGQVIDGSADELKAQAEAAWENRLERASVEKAIMLWQHALVATPADADILARLSRAYYYLADGFLRLEGDDDAILKTHEAGVSAGEEAMVALSPEFAAKVKAEEPVEEAIQSIGPQGQAALYWYAANLGRFALRKGFTTTLYYKDRIYAVMQRVMAIDETFLDGAPHRYFGAFYAKAPSFAGGDIDKSKVHFEKALELGPNYFGNRVLYAEYYARKTEDRALFESLLNAVKEADPAVVAQWLPENTLEQGKASQLLSQADDLF